MGHLAGKLWRGTRPNERYSLPFFFEPNFDALVDCLDTCCSDDKPPKYPPITAGQHLLNMTDTC